MILVSGLLAPCPAKSPRLPAFSLDRPGPFQHPQQILAGPLHASTWDWSHIKKTRNAHRMAPGPEAPSRERDKGRRAFSSSGLPHTRPCSLALVLSVPSLDLRSSSEERGSFCGSGMGR